jgi:raffinose/stachyose/melibiose transport system permease protein
MKAGRMAKHFLLVLLGLVYLVPLYLVVVNAFKTQLDITSSPFGLPLHRLTFANITAAATDPLFKLTYAYSRTALITLPSVFLILLVSSMLSYYLARSEARVGKYLTLFILGGLMVPPTVVLLPIIRVFEALHLLFSFQGLVLFNVGFYVPFAVFVLTRFVRTIPRELDEAAEMDGASRMAIFFRVILPLLRPALITLFVLLCIFIWNDFVIPLVILGPNGGYTVTTGIFRAIGQYNTNWAQVYAFILLAAAPMIVVYMVLQRRIIGGLTEGAVKG